MDSYEDRINSDRNDSMHFFIYIVMHLSISVLSIELRAPCIIIKYFNTELYTQPFGYFFKFIWRQGSHYVAHTNLRFGGSPAIASRVAGIVRVHHSTQAAL